MIEWTCGYDCPPVEYPDDWIFGGATGTDPRADPRWRPTTYEYYNERVEVIHVSQTPTCDEQAIDEFTSVGSYGRSFNPVNVSARRPDGKIEMLAVRYDKQTDEAVDI